MGEEDELESRTTPLQEGEDDEDITPMDTHNTPPNLDLQGPMTRARARRLNLEVSSFLRSSLYVTFETGLLPNDYFMIRNHGEDQEMMGEGAGNVEDQQELGSQSGGPIKTDFESVSEPRSSLH